MWIRRKLGVLSWPSVDDFGVDLVCGKEIQSNRPRDLLGIFRL